MKITTIENFLNNPADKLNENRLPSCQICSK